MIERHEERILTRNIARDPDTVPIQEDIGLEFQLHSGGDIHPEFFGFPGTENGPQGKTVVE